MSSVQKLTRADNNALNLSQGQNKELSQIKLGSEIEFGEKKLQNQDLSFPFKPKS